MSRKVRVLVVEDEVLIAHDLRMMLEDLGLTVVGVAKGGREAIEVAGRERPEVIMMDVILADEIDGVEAAATILRSCNTAIIYVTASTDPQTFDRIGASEHHALIRKPYDDASLRRALAQAGVSVD